MTSLKNPIIYRCCSCGGQRFSAKQVCYHDIVVDQMGLFEEDLGVSDSERPYGPFVCIKCSKEYESLSD